MITLIPASPADVDTTFSIIRQAQKHLKEQGIDQWQNGYPNRARLEQDVQEGIGYLVTDGPEILGYLCIVLTGEPSYDEIEGQWLSGSDAKSDGPGFVHNGQTTAVPPYAVIHRIAFAETARGRGLSPAVFGLAEDFCRERKVPALRIDTHADNKKMQHVLTQNGFSFCGIITCANGLRRAYEKLL